MLRRLSVMLHVKDHEDSPSPQKCGTPKISTISMDSAPYADTQPIRRRNRLLSVENTLTEVITMYEKLKKGRDSGVSQINLGSDDFKKLDSLALQEADEGEEHESNCTANCPDKSGVDSLEAYLNVNRFKNFCPTKYLYFSEATFLLQPHQNEFLSPDFGTYLKAKNYWLNITNPDEKDYEVLKSSYGVHDLTIADIREPNSEEKIEIFKNYTFFSMRLMREDIEARPEQEDVDFNILLFQDSIVTLHSREWPSITDILAFLHRISTHNLLTPDWVLASIFIELSQDAKGFMDLIEPEVNKIRIGSKSAEMSDIMRVNFDVELQVYAISRFIRPKMRILRQLKQRGGERLNANVRRVLSDIADDFREQSNYARHLVQILERSQDTFLAIVTSDQSREGIEMNRVMKRISEIALVFLPIQAIGGFMGMNCQVPFQSDTAQNTMFFWIIVGSCVIIGLTMFILRTRILN